MIVEWFLSVAATVLTALLDVLPGFSLPENWDSVMSQWSGIFGIASDLHMWVPLSAAAAAGLFLFSAVVIAFGVRVGRILLSFLTAGGGSAA